MRKRILQICLSDAWGGLEMVAFETAVRLHAQGFDVLAAVMPESPLAQKLRAREVPTIELKPHSKYFALRTIVALRRLSFDTVLVQQLRDLWQIVPALIGRPRIRLVGVAHMWVGVKKRDFLHRWLYGRLNYLVALTDIHKQNLIAQLPLRDTQIVVLPNTVDSKRFAPEKRRPELRHEFGLTDDEPLIGVVSRLDPKKGLSEVVKAAAEMKAMGVPGQILIVGAETRGEESFKARLESEIRERGLDSRVRLTGPRADIEAVMATLDILLMPSPEETFGRVLIEAMASGVAVIASRGGGVPDIVDHERTGLWVDVGDSAAIAVAVKRLIENPSLRTRLAAAGLKKAREVYNPSTVERAFDNLLL